MNYYCVIGYWAGKVLRLTVKAESYAAAVEASGFGNDCSKIEVVELGEEEEFLAELKE